MMISSTQSFSDFANVDLKNLLKTHCCATLNKDIRSIHINVKKKITYVASDKNESC